VRVEACLRLCFFVKRVFMSTENVFREKSIDDNLYFATLSCRSTLTLSRPRGFLFFSYSVLMVPPEVALVYGLSSWIYSRDARSQSPPYFLYTKKKGIQGLREEGGEGGMGGMGEEGL
jgi:hypothetical protein